MLASLHLSVFYPSALTLLFHSTVSISIGSIGFGFIGNILDNIQMLYSICLCMRDHSIYHFVLFYSFTQHVEKYFTVIRPNFELCFGSQASNISN